MPFRTIGTQLCNITEVIQIIVKHYIWYTSAAVSNILRFVSQNISYALGHNLIQLQRAGLCHCKDIARTA